MAKQVTIRRGTTAEHSTFTGAEGEITVDTTKDTVVVHDGVTDGGFPLALESSALSDAEIKTAYENNADTNEFSDAEQSKLTGIEASATADQSDVEIKTAYENNADTNAFTDAEQSKLTGIETSADETDDANVRAALAAATADIAVNTQKITGVVDPTADQDAATKVYVDSVANGLETKGSVRVATTGTNITLSGLQIIDGVSVSDADRVLVKDQTNTTENGIYDVAAGAWSRSGDADNTPGGELGPGSFTFVEEGTTQADNGYVATGIATGTGVLAGYFVLEVDNIEFSQFSGAGQITAGINLNKDGNTINLDTTLTNFASTGIDDNATSTAIIIDSSENIGIGGSPNSTFRLNVIGKLAAGDGTDFSPNSAGDGHITIKGNAYTGYLTLDAVGVHIGHNSASRVLTFDINETEAMRINANGDVGIGGIPAALLHVDSDQNLALADNSENLLARISDTFVDGANIINFDIINRAHATRDNSWHNSATRLESRIDSSSTANSWIEFRHFVGSPAGAIAFGEGSGDSGQWMIIKEGQVGIGIEASDGTLHVQTASAGVITANSDSDDLVVENNSNTGISILTPASSQGGIRFGSPTNDSSGAILYEHSVDRMDFQTVATRRMTIDSTGSVLINDLSNANMTIGLTINQGANDNQIFCLKSSDVATGLTSASGVNTETDDFFVMVKNNATLGGTRLESHAEDGALSNVLTLVAIGGTANTNKNSAGIGLADFFISEHDGANTLTNVTANGNIFSIRHGPTARTAFIVDEDGDLFADSGTTTTAVTVFDGYDDTALVRAFDIAKNGVGFIKSKWDEYVDYNEQDLVDLGILGDTRANGGLVCITRLQQLHNGAIWQMSIKQKEMEAKLKETNDLLTQTTIVLEQAMKQLALLEGPNNG